MLGLITIPFQGGSDATGVVRHDGQLSCYSSALDCALDTAEGKLSVCYETDPCGYGVYREVTGWGIIAMLWLRVWCHAVRRVG